MIKFDKIIKGFFIIILGIITPVIYISSNEEYYNKTNVKVNV